MSTKVSVIKTNKHFYAILHKAEDIKICISTLKPIFNEQIEEKLSDPLFSLLVKKYNDKEISLLTFQYILKKFYKDVKGDIQQNFKLLLEYSIESGFLTKKDKMFLQKKITN